MVNLIKRILTAAKSDLEKREYFRLFLAALSVVFVYLLITFVGVTEDVVESAGAIRLDQQITTFLLNHRTPELVDIFLHLTRWGQSPNILFAIGGTALALYLWHKSKYLVPMILTIVGAELTIYFTKLAIERSRPASDIAYYLEKSFSFPSGHAAVSIALYGFLIFLLWQNVLIGWQVKVFGTLVGSIFILGIGFSRLYLGVHYFTDVMGGFLVGGLWLVGGIALAEVLQHRRRRRDAAKLDT